MQLLSDINVTYSCPGNDMVYTQRHKNVYLDDQNMIMYRGGCKGYNSSGDYRISVVGTPVKKVHVDQQGNITLQLGVYYPRNNLYLSCDSQKFEAQFPGLTVE